MSSPSTTLHAKQAAAAPVSRARTILAGSVGNAVEWFDWTIYASFAIFFSSQFFPKATRPPRCWPRSASSRSVFMRPVGGWLLGIFSDRYGRKAALGLTILMMAGGSLIIAVTPTYATIGLAAPLLLTAARLLQGLSLGGEYACHDLPGGNGAVQPPWFLFQLRLLQRRRRHPGRVRRGLGADVHPDQARDGRLGLAHSVPAGALGGLAGLWIRRSIRRPKPSRTARRPAWKSSRCAPLREHPVEVLRIVGSPS